MSDSEQNCQGKGDQEKWLNGLRMEIGKCEALLPKTFLDLDDDGPKWVQKIERELCLPLFPAAKLRDPNFVITPKRMGAMIGHMCELAVLLKDGINDVLKKLADLAEKLPDIGFDEGDKELEEIDHSIEKFLAAIRLWYASMRRLAKRALCSAVDQSYDDMNDFLLGYADAFSRKPKKFKVGDVGSTASEIYFLMVTRWQVIEKMESVRQLHEWLGLHLGKFKVGDQKRVEKICQRAGLSFRKAGRPKGK